MFIKFPFLRYVVDPAGNNSEGGGTNPPTTPPGDSADSKQGEPKTPAGDSTLSADAKAAGEALARAEKAEQELAALKKAAEDATKTEAEKAADALRAAQETAADATIKALKYEVAAELGIALALASRLTGKTREELVKDGETLKQHLGTNAQQKQGLKPDSTMGGKNDDTVKSVGSGRELYLRLHGKKQ